ncbi:MAG TPA: DUF5661 family protein [Nitrospira sp.]|nr:DUF5661 family protein [Nitrospira sp.]
MKRTYRIDEAREIAQSLSIDFTKAGFNLEQFRAGLDVEAEHGVVDPETNVTNDDPLTTGKIALAHLNEIPDYYTRLQKMEVEAEASAPRQTTQADNTHGRHPAWRFLALIVFSFVALAVRIWSSRRRKSAEG